MKHSDFRMDIRVTLLYALFGGLWILLSDRALVTLVADIHTLNRLQTYKGWAFVLLSSLLIYLLLRQALGQIRAEEDKLRESEARYRQLFEHSMDAIVLTAPDGSIFAANPAACQMFGRAEAEIIQGGRDGIMDTSDPRLASALQERARHGSFHGELTFIRKDCSKFPGEISSSLFKNPQGLERTSMIIRDITERKRAEEEVRARQELFQKTFDISPLPSVLTKLPERTVVDVNPAFEKLFGYTHTETIGKSIMAFDLWADASERQHVAEILMKGGSVHNYEFKFKTKSGETGDGIFYSEIISQLTEKYVLTKIMDITERKLAEMALKESEERYRQLLDVSPIGIAVHCEGKLVFTNRAGAKLIGASHPEEVIGKSIFEIIHPDNLAAARERIQRMLAGEQGLYPTEDRYLRLDGSAVPVEVRAVPLTYEGKPAVQVIVQDITERKRAEAEIRQRSQHLALLNEITRAALETTELDALLQTLADRMCKLLDADGCYITVWDSAQKKPIPAAASGELRQVYPSLTYQPGESNITEAVMQAQHALIAEDVFNSPYISPRIAIQFPARSLMGLPLITAEQKLGAALIAHNKPHQFTDDEIARGEQAAGQVSLAIARAQLLEQVQRHAAELEQRVTERTAQLTFANKQLESFSYSVSHDLRAPLRAINGFATIIARRHRQALNEEGQHYFDNIVQASERMSHLIDDLLAYSRLGRSGVRHVAVPLDQILVPIVSDLQGHLAGLCGKIELAEGLPTVQGDATLLNQIFSNLIENALTYRQPDRPSHIRIDYQTEGTDVIIQVSDNGIGIPAEHHERIFNIFQRLHSDDEYPGTGIGLATVKKAVDLLGGTVWVESKVGEGSSFFVRLPG